MLKKIKKLIPNSVKIATRNAVNFLIPGETPETSKNKWNNLAAKNARYFVLTDFGENISEEKFREAGEKDFAELIANDEVIKSRLGDLKNKTAMEIGCGIGRITEFLSLNFKNVFAVDISEEMVRIGRNRLKNSINIKFMSNDGKKYPSIEDSTIDFVFSYIVFQHMANKKIVIENLEEIKRILTPNGIAKIQLRGLPTSKLNWFYGPSFNEDGVRKILSSLGLKLIKAEGENQRYFWIWFSK